MRRLAIGPLDRLCPPAPVGFSMCTGEVARYLGKYGSPRVRKAVLLGAIPPFVLKTDDNPEGVDGEIFEGILPFESTRP